MNKTKMILAATGGAVGLAVLVMAYFVWSAYSAKTAAMDGNEETGGLLQAQGDAERLSSVAGGKIYPCPESVKGVESNTAVVVAWRDEAGKLASSGDRPVKVTTTAQFKSDIVEEAKRLAAFPGVANGKLVKPDFAFGPFKPYVAEGQMPAEAKLAELTRQWDDVVLLVETLAASGITELLDIRLKTVDEAPKAEEDSRGKNKKARKTAKKSEATADSAKFAEQSYVFVFTTRAPGLIKVVNALTTGERFVVIDGMTFVREKDVIAEALGDGESKAAAQATSGRRGRRRGAVQTEEGAEKKEEAKNSIVTDPLLDAPLKVELAVTVYDFRSMESEKAEEKGDAK